MSQENVVQARVLLRFGRGATRLFRINSGMGWVGKIVSKTRDLIVLDRPQPFHGAPTGSADLLGWTSIEVTPAMVGRRLAVFVAVEVKSERGVPTTEQKAFAAAVRAAGGVAVVARTESEVEAALATAGGPNVPTPALLVPRAR